MTASPLTGRWPKPRRSAAPRPPLSRSPRRWRGRGHQVEVRNRCHAALTHKGVRWAPLSGRPARRLRSLYRQSRASRDRAGPPGPAAAVLAAQSRRISEKAAQSVAARPLSADCWSRPGPITRRRSRRWLPCGGRRIIPYGVLDRFRRSAPREPPPPRAIFTSNPLRGLDWLLDLWVARIAPAVPRRRTAHLCRRGGLWQPPPGQRQVGWRRFCARCRRARRLRGAPLRAGRA